MNRKNVIQNLFFAFATIIVVGLLAWQHEEMKGLEETLHENEKTLSETNATLDSTAKELSTIAKEKEQTAIQLEETLHNVDALKKEADSLSAKVSEMTSTNAKLQKEKDQLQADYNTLKKNKAIAAEKAKQQSSSQSSTYQWKGTNKEYVAVSRSNNQTATKTFYVTATAYTAYCAGCSGITRTGLNLRKNPNMKVIAVDPRVIPLGSKVWVDGYGYAVAGDTGGAIKGNKVDLFMSSKNAAYKWGRKKVQIKVF